MGNDKSQSPVGQGRDLPGNAAAEHFDAQTFDKNLFSLFRLDATASEHLRRLPRPGAEVRLFRTRSGDTGVFARGRFLTSRYDPVKEARKELEKITQKAGGPPKTLCVLGCAGGHLIHAALETGCKDVHVFEPDPEDLSETLGTEDFTKAIEAGFLRFAAESDKLYFTVSYKLKMEPDLALVISPAYRKAYPEAIRELCERIGTLIRNTDILAQTAAVKMKTWFDYAIENLPVFLSHPGIDALRGTFAKVPVVIVSAGPSLDKNVHYLKDFRDRVMIISVGTSLWKLDRIGVVPDLAVALESNDISGQFEGVSFLPQTHLALDLKCFPDLWRLPTAGIFGFTGSAGPNQWLLKQTGRDGCLVPVGGSVATASFSIAEVLGADPIILIGQDLAFSETGALHAGDIGLLGAEDIDKELDEKDDEAALAKKGIFLVEGYEGTPVMTKTNLRNYLLWFEKSVTAITSLGRRAINCTEGGARIRGFEQRPLKEILEELPPIGFKVSDRFAVPPKAPPPDLAGVFDVFLATEKKARRLRFLAKRYLGTIEETFGAMGREGINTPKVKRALRKAEQTDKENLALL